MACLRCGSPNTIEAGVLVCSNPKCGRIGIKSVPSQAELLKQLEVLQKEVERLKDLAKGGA